MTHKEMMKFKKKYAGKCKFPSTKELFDKK